MPIGDHQKPEIDYLLHGQKWSAIAFLEAIRKLRLPFKSVLDVGCCVGEWLRVFKQGGTGEIFGIDSPHIEDEWLVIPKERFMRHDLDYPFDLNRKFQLVLCLETAEHVRPAAAYTLVNSLVKHGDIILFGAAIPGQGGAGHVNEQEPAYWVEKFAAFEYKVIDCIRPLVWDVFMCEYWYQQNAFIFANDTVIHQYPSLKEWRARTGSPEALLRYHPKRWPNGGPN